MKKSTYLCKTKTKWSVRLLDRTDFFSEIKKRFESFTDYKNMARSSTGLARETDLSV